MNKALVIGSDSRGFLAVSRSLGRKGIAVHAARTPDRGLKPIAYSSRYIEKEIYLPSLTEGVCVWRDSLLQHLMREPYDLVIPCTDGAVYATIQSRVGLSQFSRLAIPNPEGEIFFDKPSSARLAAELGVPVPTEKPIEDASEAAQIAHQFGLPFILKPVSSVSEANPGLRRKVGIARTVEQAEDYVRRNLPFGGLIAQRIFTGSGVGVEVLCKEGTVQFAFQHERLHESRLGGASSYRESSNLNPDLFNAVRQLIQATKYNGLAMFEFIFDKSGKKWVFLECNARVWGSLPLAIESGADFPYRLFQQEVHGEQNVIADYRVGVRSKNLSLEVAWLSERFQGRNRLASESWKLASTLGVIFETVLGKTRNDCLVRDDPLPGLLEIFRTLFRPFHMILRQLRSLPERFRAAGNFLKSKQRIRKLVPNAKTILFVCKGNICRSPFAHRYLDGRLTEKLAVRSVGYFPKQGRSSPYDAVTVANHFEVDLSLHKSQVASEGILAWADIVFVFDNENWQAIVERYPGSRKKVVMLGATLGVLDATIRDPYGKTPKDFEVCYSKIRDAVSRLPLSELQVT